VTEKLSTDMGPNKTGATGHENLHEMTFRK